MLAAMLKFMFIYNQFMMLDSKSFRECVCVFEATLTRSKINWGFVYLCIRSKDFVPICTISDYIHWAALTVWFFVFFITSMKSGMFENTYILILFYSIYMYYRHSVKPIFKPTFVDSYINYSLFIFLKVPLAIYLTKNKNTILLIIKPFKLVKTF